MELALNLGGTVEELQARMSWREFLFWQARYERQPFGTEWENIRSGAISTNICAGLGCKDQKIENHIPRSKQRGRKQTPAEQWAVLSRFRAQHLPKEA